jgi:hypothetical protein
MAGEKALLFGSRNQEERYIRRASGRRGPGRISRSGGTDPGKGASRAVGISCRKILEEIWNKLFLYLGIFSEI